MTPALTAAQLIDLLELTPHPEEGGFFRETYRAAGELSPEALGGAYASARSPSTAIYYLLTPETFSELHRLPTDEVFHYYLGDPVEQLRLLPGGASEVVTLGPDLAAGHRVQSVVPAGVWQGAALAPGGSWCLLGCTVAPGFDYADYQRGEARPLAEGWPERAAEIAHLSRG